MQVNTEPTVLGHGLNVRVTGGMDRGLRIWLPSAAMGRRTKGGLAPARTPIAKPMHALNLPKTAPPGENWVFKVRRNGQERHPPHLLPSSLTSHIQLTPSPSCFNSTVFTIPLATIPCPASFISCLDYSSSHFNNFPASNPILFQIILFLVAISPFLKT
jgi:hypothetical protein